jgi:hypothetical protein
MNSLLEVLSEGKYSVIAGAVCGLLAQALFTVLQTLLVRRKFKHESELLMKIRVHRMELQKSGANPEELNRLIKKLELDVSEKVSLGD